MISSIVAGMDSVLCNLDIVWDMNWVFIGKWYTTPTVTISTIYKTIDTWWVPMFHACSLAPRRLHLAPNFLNQYHKMYQCKMKKVAKCLYNIRAHTVWWPICPSINPKSMQVSDQNTEQFRNKKQEKRNPLYCFTLALLSIWWNWKWRETYSNFQTFSNYDKGGNQNKFLSVI